MVYVLGVDLGTTYSAAAIADADRARILPLGNRSATVPSVVTLRADGEVLVGEAAERRALTEPTRTAREFKRRLGDPTPLLLGGTPYGAESLMGHLLRWIVEKVSEQQGAAPDGIVLSHPANWGPYKLDLLTEAVRQADVGDVSFITEPEAAAIHYAQEERLEPGDVVAVYDFGGGTFDAAVLRRTDDGFDLIGTPEGMERIGGIDFDQAVFAHVDLAVGGSVRELDTTDASAAAAAVSRLREECQSAKEALSQDTDVDIPILLPSLSTEVRLTRPEFEQMIRPRIAETVSALQRAVRSAGLEMDQVSKILLVGGSSRIPLVAQLVREATGRPIALDAHPKHTIAIGAAMLGLAGAGRGAATEREVAEDLTAATAPAVMGAAVTEAGDAGTDDALPSPDVRPPSTPTSEPTPGRSRVPVLVGGAVALLALIAVGATALSGGEDPEDEPSPAATSPGPYATTSPGDGTAGVAGQITELNVYPDGSLEVYFETTGFTPGEGGNELEFRWVDEWTQPVAGTSPVSWTSAEVFNAFHALKRPVAARSICFELTGPDAPDEQQYSDQCRELTTAVRQSLPGQRFLEVGEIRLEGDQVVATYTPYGFDPTIGPEGTNHVHFYWFPTSTEDTVGVNIPAGQQGSWAAWDAEVFDAFTNSSRPPNATHLCAVVAEYDHSILLQEDGTGFPSGTCLIYDEESLTSSS
ncbi:MAG TPA: Hsp70 family protein [Nitriliruptorales bacterium]